MFLGELVVLSDFVLDIIWPVVVVKGVVFACLPQEWVFRLALINCQHATLSGL